MNLSLEDLASIIQEEFLDILDYITYPAENKLRIILTENTFIDVFLSQKQSGLFSFHWERRHKNGTLYRYDNYPDPQWKKVSTFPYHFHKKVENKVVKSPFSKTPPKAFTDFMEFVHKTIRTSQKGR